jgi:hypothetical protein
MKRRIELINVEEVKLKETLDEAVSQRENQKLKCEKIKKSIKDVRDALKKSITEFGTDQDLDSVEQAPSIEERRQSSEVEVK